MKVFRPTLLAAALIVTLTASLAHAQNADQLPRAKVALVARRKSTRMSRWPKAAQGGRVHHDHRGKEDGDRRQGHHAAGHDL